MEVVRTLEADRWRAFVDSHPQSNIFHTPEMFKVFALAKGHQPELWAVLDGEEIVSLLLPVRITMMSPLLRALTTRAITYGGLLCTPDRQGLLATRQLLAAYTGQIGRSVLFSEFRNLHDQGLLRSTYNDCGFVYEKHLNYLIDLTGSVEEVFQRIGSRTRKSLRRGLRRGDVKLTEVSEHGDVADCYDLIKRSYRNAHVPLADRSLFEAAFAILTPGNMLRFYLARVEGIPVAASAELFYKNTIYGWYSGVDRSYSDYIPGDLLMWHVLRWGAENGYQVYDFGGAGKPDQAYGVRDFKSKFGGKLVEYGRFAITHAPLRIRLSKIGYSIYQQLHRLWSDRCLTHRRKET
ncbi:MAG: GNAT family N-acetyltransferase [Anaerolineae bacterium]|nr:GNAT family N-acetyltransferase [Anaerolineae bacterium]